MNLKTAYIIWLILIVVAFLLLCGYSHQWKNTILLENINVHDTKWIYEEDVIKLAGLKKGIPLYKINLDSVRLKILSNPYLSDLIINKQFSGNLDIRVFEKEIEAYIFFADKLWYIDNKGNVIQKLKLKNIPVVPVITGININNIKNMSENEKMQIATAIDVISKMKNIDENLYLLISEVNVNQNNDVIIYTNDNATPLIIGKHNIEEKLKLLSVFWKKFVINLDTEKLKHIDARFKDLIVVSWKENKIENSL